MKKLTFLLLCSFAVLLLTFIPQTGFSAGTESKQSGSEKVEKAKETVQGTEKGKEAVKGTDKSKEAATKEGKKGKAVAPGSQFTGKVNINTCTAEELMQIKGVGETIAGRITEHRKKIGKFKSIEEIKDVKGIGEKKFLQIKDNLTL